MKLDKKLSIVIIFIMLFSAVLEHRWLQQKSAIKDTDKDKFHKEQDKLNKEQDKPDALDKNQDNPRIDPAIVDKEDISSEETEKIPVSYQLEMPKENKILTHLHIVNDGETLTSIIRKKYPGIKNNNSNIVVLLNWIAENNKEKIYNVDKLLRGDEIILPNEEELVKILKK